MERTTAMTNPSVATFAAGTWSERQLETDGAKDATSASWQIFMMVLCVLALLILVADTFLAFSPSTDTILQYTDNFVCVVFLGDFAYNLTVRKHKVRYLRTWGWIDLLSSIPTLDAFRIGRAARIVRIIKVLRAMRSARVVGHFLMVRRAQSAVLSVVLTCILLVVFGSLAILQFEIPSGGNIQTADDALWWSISTMTAVGNSEKFATTSEGRFIALLLIAAGVGLFTTISGLLTSWFLSPAAQEADADIAELKKSVDLLRQEIGQRA